MAKKKTVQPPKSEKKEKPQPDWWPERLRPGDQVIRMSHKGSYDRYPAIVGGVNHLDHIVEAVVLYQGGALGHSGMRHEDDPGNIEWPERIEEGGVFVVGPVTERQWAIEDNLRAMDVLMSKMMDRVAELESGKSKTKIPETSLV